MVEPHKWPSDIILDRMQSLEGKIDTLTVLIVGVKDTASKGLIGDVRELYKSRNECKEDIAKIKERCNMEHGKDPGASHGQTVEQAEQTLWEFFLKNKGPFLKVIMWSVVAGGFVVGVIFEIARRTK